MYIQQAQSGTGAAYAGAGGALFPPLSARCCCLLLQYAAAGDAYTR